MLTLRCGKGDLSMRIKEQKNILKQDTVDKITESMTREPQSQTYPIEVLVNKIKRKEILINEEYQRNYITNDVKASKFVESVFLGCVIPEVQFFEETNGTYEIIDGQQRIVSLARFYNNEYKIQKLEELKELNGLYFKDLPQILQNKYKNYGVLSRIMKSNGNKDYKFFVFERLNIDAKPLKKQEIRNSIYRNSELLKRLKKFCCEDNKINTFFKNCHISNERYDALELVLRMISISETFPYMEITADKQINKYLEQSFNFSEQKIKETLDDFTNTMNLLIKYFEDVIFHQMTINKGKVRKSWIETIYISICCKYFSEDIIKTNLKEMQNNVINVFSEQFSQDNQHSTNYRKTIIKNSISVIKSMRDAMHNFSDGAVIKIPDIKRLELWAEQLEQQKKVKCIYCGKEIKDYKNCQIAYETRSVGLHKPTKELGLIHKKC